MTTITENVRLRVEFKERHILSKLQRTEGLKRSWILLKPHHRTISDLAAHLLHAFGLHGSCPDGLLISMDGFVLPPFESTSIFKDKDIVSVKRKGGILSEIALPDDDTNAFEVEEIVERQPLNTGIKLLANEEFEKETGGYESESEEDEPDQLEATLPVEEAPQTGRRSKKRKLSSTLHSSKRKKIKSATPEEPSGFPEGQGDVLRKKKERSHQSCVHTKKSPSKKDTSFTGEVELKNPRTPETDKRTNKKSKSTLDGKRSCQLKENEMKGVVSSDILEGSKKLPSRSARRKKAKRQWLREKMKAEKEELHQRELVRIDNQKSSGKVNKRCSEEHQQPNTDNGKKEEQSNTDDDEADEPPKTDTGVDVQPDLDNDEEVDIVPVVIRPGHIRFEPIRTEEGDQPIPQNINPVENFQWNGITSKKRGKKWGMERTPHYRKSDYNELSQDSPEILDVEKQMPVDGPMDFNRLDLCTTLPKAGDQIAYRLIELSSCWTPEVSAYRVGKVSWYNPRSNKIMLLQVPEHPIVFEETDEASDELPYTSLYGEDGSLEVEYSSLIDVRMFKHGNRNTEKAVTRDQNAASESSRANNDKETRAPTQASGKVSAWDEISNGLNAKKAQLSQEDGWSTKESSERSSWSYRGLRGSALGPTVARLNMETVTQKKPSLGIKMPHQNPAGPTMTRKLVLLRKPVER